MGLALPVATEYGHAKPRVAPPVPAKSDLRGFKKVCGDIGITPMPWQIEAARYLEALGMDGRHLFGEVAIIVSRQNGKTTELIPLIVKRLRAGRRIMHTAQNRELPREVFGEVAEIIGGQGKLLLKRRGRVVMPRFANGQEEIKLANGGRYRIVAPTRGGARGPSNDDVIVDEVRELESFEFIGAAKPTMTASADPQIVWLSNMGDADSVVLKSILDRAGVDPRLAVLEWSAGPDRKDDDRDGWLEANPSAGHFPWMLRYLEDEHRSAKLGGTLPIFETEHLCRSQNTRRVQLVSASAWNDREVTALEEPTGRPFMGIGLDPEGRRAAAAEAWRQADGLVAARILYDVTGSPIDTDTLGKDLKGETKKRNVAITGFDSATDAQLARYFLRKKPIVGQEWANACARFVELVEGKKLIWHDAGPVASDLSWATRQAVGDKGAFAAVAASEDHPIPALLALIRAVWLASEPQRPAAKRTPQAQGF